MNNISIPTAKWIEVYNSTILLIFFSHEYKNNNSSIKEVNRRYNDFCKSNNIPGNDFQFEGGSNTLSFCYLIIVRIIELTNIFVTDHEKKIEFFGWVVETAKQNGVISFDDLMSKYEIDIHTFTHINKEADGEKLYQFFRHLRHSISHYSYSVNVNKNSVNFKSINTKKNETELEASMPMHQLINLTSQFGLWVNNTLHDRKLLS
jgi:hypothetical protein